MKIRLAAAVLWFLTTWSGSAHAFRYLDLSSLGAGIPRWDAAPRNVDGVERSLSGGLRYSVQGGSYEAYRDLFQWVGTPPTVADFETAIEEAFNAWTVTDPATALQGAVSFVADLGTPVVNDLPPNLLPANLIGLNDGAEIDLLAGNDGPGCDPPDCDFAGVTVSFIDVTTFDDLTLTSGTTNYSGFAISGSDILINDDPLWTLEFFQFVLTHEIGHALGLVDADLFPGPGGFNSAFVDDNYDGTSSATALATLTNSFADLVDPIDPDNSTSLSFFTVDDGDPGIDTPGVDILMESNGGVLLAGLQNDDYAGRQFLYPFVAPPPLQPRVPALSAAALPLLAGSLLGIAAYRLQRWRC